MAQAREEFVNGVRLAYLIHENPGSPTMVLLHALGERGSDWKLVTERLAESFQVITLDLRGHGDSDWPGDYSFRVMCDDVIGFLDNLDLGPAVVIGHSMGGVIAYLVAIHRSDLVEKLVIEDVSPPYKRDRPVPEPPADPQSLDFDWAVVPAIVAEVNAGNPQMWADLSKIAAPSLLIGGGSDSHIPQDKLDAAAKRINSCDLLTISAGHHIHSNDPETFSRSVLGWIQS